jgi:hypothetical protein
MHTAYAIVLQGDELVVFGRGQRRRKHRRTGATARREQMRLEREVEDEKGAENWGKSGSMERAGDFSDGELDAWILAWLCNAIEGLSKNEFSLEKIKRSVGRSHLCLNYTFSISE